MRLAGPTSVRRRWQHTTARTLPDRNEGDTYICTPPGRSMEKIAFRL
jgi:hypothetical protein